MPTFVDKHGREGEISDADVESYGGDAALAQAGYTRKGVSSSGYAGADQLPGGDKYEGAAAGQVERPTMSSSARKPQKIRLVTSDGRAVDVTDEQLAQWGGIGEVEKKYGKVRVAGEGADTGLIGAGATLAQIPYQVRTAAGAVDKVAGTNLEQYAKSSLPATTPDDQRRMDNTLVTSAIGGLDGIAKFTGMQTIADVAAAALAMGGHSQAAQSFDKMTGLDTTGALNSAAAAARVPIVARGVQASAAALQAMQKPGVQTHGVDSAILRVGNELGIDPAQDPEGFVKALRARNPGTYAMSELAGGLAGAEQSSGAANGLLEARQAAVASGTAAGAVPAALSFSQQAAKNPVVPRILAWATGKGIAPAAARGAAVGGGYGFFEGVDKTAQRVLDNPDQTASSIASTALSDVFWGTTTGVAVGAGMGAFGEILSKGSGWMKTKALANEGEASARWANKEKSLRAQMQAIDESIAKTEIAAGQRESPKLVELKSRRDAIQKQIDSALAEQDLEAAENGADFLDKMNKQAEKIRRHEEVIQYKLAQGKQANLTPLVNAKERYAAMRPAEPTAKPADLTPLMDIEQEIAANTVPKRPLTPQEQRAIEASSAYSSKLGKQADKASKMAAAPGIDFGNIARSALTRGGQFEAGSLGIHALTGRGHIGAGAITGGAFGAARALIGDPMAVARAEQAVSTTLAGGAALMDSQAFIKYGVDAFDRMVPIGKPVEHSDDALFAAYSGQADEDPYAMAMKTSARLAPYLSVDAAKLVGQKVGNVYEFLKSVKPRPASQDPFTNDPTGVPSVDEDEKRKFIAHSEVADYRVVTARLTQGLLTTYHIEAMEALHPDTLRAMREAYLRWMIDLVNAGKWKDVDEGRRQQLKILFGMDVDSPGAIRNLQVTFSASKDAVPVGPGASDDKQGPARPMSKLATPLQAGTDEVEKNL